MTTNRKRRIVWPLALAMMSLVGCGSQPPAPIGPASISIDDVAGEFVPDELIVLARPGADRTDMEVLFSDADATIRGEMTTLSAYLIGFASSQRDGVRASLSASPLVEDLADNRLYEVQRIPNDPQYAGQWHLSAIGAPAAWDITTGSEGVSVAVVDTGIDGEHADLGEKVVAGANLYESSGDTRDLNGHGTAVAGTIAAIADNGQGVASIAWANPVVPIRVTSEKGHTTSWLLAAGIGEAVDQGARVVNVSFAPLQEDELVLRQVRLAWLSGSLVVISSGNDGQEVEGGGSEWALFVGAVSRSGRRAAFSTYGDFLDLVAPGVSITTTGRGGGYGSYSGTSFAAPVAAGVAALAWSVNPGLHVSTVKEILLTTADDLGEPGGDVQFGHGLVNAKKAVERSQEIVETQDVTAPAVSIASPIDGASVSGDVAIAVEASDDIDVADVTLYVDGTVVADDALGPYLFVLTTSRYAVGQHELKVVAADTTGNAAEQVIIVHFSGVPDAEAPGVTITSPGHGATVSGIVTILADAWDNRGLASADILLDGQVIAAISLALEAQTSVAYNWNAMVGSVTTGAHELTVRVVDTSGNEATSSVRVWVAK